MSRTKEERAAHAAAEYERNKRWRAKNPNYNRRYYLANKDALLAKNRVWRAANGRKQRDAKLRASFGITLEQYDTLLTLQASCCKICGTDTPRGKGTFHVDHCHETGRIRGLLCHSCNVGLGQFKHSPDLLLQAVNYLL